MKSVVFAATSAMILFAGVVWLFASQASRPQPLALPLACTEGNCPLLRGAPQTTGMRSGLVRLKPAESVGWHTTGPNEEALVILQGQGEALLEGHPKLTLAGPGFAYMPPATRHNVVNTGNELLEYVYVVAPAKTE